MRGAAARSAGGFDRGGSVSVAERAGPDILSWLKDCDELRRPTVFFVPGLGGRAAGFAALGAELGGFCSHALELPGFDGATPPLETVDEIARALCAQVQAASPRGPLALLGYSLGGVIAIEMTRRLEQEGRRVVFLGLLDSVTPEQMRRRPKEEVLAVWTRFLLSGDRSCRIASLRERLRMSLARLRRPRGPDGRRIPVLGQEDPKRHGRDYNNAAMTALWAATLKASRCYAPTPLLREVWLFRSTLGAILAYPPEEVYGQWETLCSTLRIVTLPGSHLDVLRRPAARRIARALREALEV